MTFAIARTVADEIRAAVGRGAAGVVVTQGTDTIEEMAYAWDLLVGGRRPDRRHRRDAARRAGQRGRRGQPAGRGAHRGQPAGARARLPGGVQRGDPLRARPCARRTRRRSRRSGRRASGRSAGSPRASRGCASGRTRGSRWSCPPDAPVVRPPVVTIALDDDGWWLPACGAGARAGRGGHRRRARARLAERPGRRAGRADPGGAGLAHRRRRGADRHLRRVRRLRDRSRAGWPDPGRDRWTRTRPGCCSGCCSARAPTTTGFARPSPRRAPSAGRRTTDIGG